MPFCSIAKFYQADPDPMDMDPPNNTIIYNISNFYQ